MGPLPDQKLAPAKHHRRALRLFTLHRHEAHGRPQCGLTDRLGIGRIVFLTLHEGLHVGGRDEPHVVAELPDLATPKMRTATGFHRDDAGWELSEKLKDLMPSQLLAKHCPT